MYIHVIDLSKQNTKRNKNGTQTAQFSLLRTFNIFKVACTSGRKCLYSLINYLKKFRVHFSEA